MLHVYSGDWVANRYQTLSERPVDTRYRTHTATVLNPHCISTQSTPYQYPIRTATVQYFCQRFFAPYCTFYDFVLFYVWYKILLPYLLYSFCSLYVYMYVAFCFSPFSISLSCCVILPTRLMFHSFILQFFFSYQIQALVLFNKLWGTQQFLDVKQEKNFHTEKNWMRHL